MSNPFPPDFMMLADAALRHHGSVLDCGSGGRKIPGVLSLDIAESEYTDMRASGLDLPFRDDSFELVLSQAVLEHVPEPQRYIDEIFRVLQPGGTLLVEVAFMQPVHQAPHHYFNVTPFGLQHLLRAYDVEYLGPFGLQEEAWRWLAVELEAEDIIGQIEITRIAAWMRRIDQKITPQSLWNTAPGVRAIARKPVVQ